MPLVKKTNPEWKPSENTGLKVGEVIDMTDARSLVAGNMAVFCDEDGNELQGPGMYSCLVCRYETNDVHNLASHMDVTHPKPKPVEEAPEPRPATDAAPVAPVAPEPTPVTSEPTIEKETVETQKTPELTKQEKLKVQRLENLRRAREAKKAKTA